MLQVETEKTHQVDTGGVHELLFCLKSLFATDHAPVSRRSTTTDLPPNIVINDGGIEVAVAH